VCPQEDDPIGRDWNHKALETEMKSRVVVFIVMLFAVGATNVVSQENEMKYNQLTAEEEGVIIFKGTEKPFSGKYDKFSESGTYLCKRCDARLYESDDKFDSRCGWPSFDDEIPGAVKRVPDADGRRTEIICNNCGAHLGHVFIGEQMTDKNTRHCVNSISLNFVSGRPQAATLKAYFAGGCFWGTEHFFRKKEGVVSTEGGYIGGEKQNPTHQEVCSGNPGHAEVIEVKYDPSLVTFEVFAILFFEIYDPSQVDRQGPDIGDQYRSAIFYTDDEQKETAERLIRILQEKGLKVATELVQADTFWKGEAYHQDYYQNTGKQPYCHVYQKRF